MSAFLFKFGLELFNAVLDHFRTVTQSAEVSIDLFHKCVTAVTEFTRHRELRDGRNTPLHAREERTRERAAATAAPGSPALNYSEQAVVPASMLPDYFPPSAGVV